MMKKFLVLLTMFFVFAVVVPTSAEAYGGGKKYKKSFNKNKKYKKSKKRKSNRSYGPQIIAYT